MHRTFQRWIGKGTFDEHVYFQARYRRQKTMRRTR